MNAAGTVPPQTNIPSLLCQHPAVAELVAFARAGGAAAARGAVGSSTTLVTAALATSLARPILLIVAHLDEADEALDELESSGIDAVRFPAVQYAKGESTLSNDLLAERLLLVRRILEGDMPSVLIAPIQALMQGIPHRTQMEHSLRIVEPGMMLDAQEFAEWLDHSGYRRVETIDGPGEFAIRGGIIDVFPPGTVPTRIDLFGDEVEGIFEIDLGTMGSDRRLQRVELISGAETDSQGENEPGLLIDDLPVETVAVLAEMLEINEQARGYFERVHEPTGIFTAPEVFKAITHRCHGLLEINHLGSGAPQRAVALPVQPLPGFSEDSVDAVGELVELASDHAVTVFCQNEGECQRMGELLAEHSDAATVQVSEQYLHRGFILRDMPQRPIAMVPYHELMHRFSVRRRVRQTTANAIAGGRAMDTFLELQPGDYVVHREHGIARFVELRHIRDKNRGTSEEFLTLEFAGSSKLHVPVTKIDLVQKYIGAFTGSPELSTIGGKRWKRQKEQVAEAVRDFAAELLRVQAAREAMPGIRYPADTAWQREFEAEFPYNETEDQLAAIAEIKRDMSNARPMDRLVCGDVGFGKTEVAMRGAFKAVEYGKQVAVLVPTTVLAEQHERTFKERFADYPFRIESLSRFKSKAQQTELLKALDAGRIDVIIGTHRLLSKDVKFADLGLLIVDEEQRFGVEHKQRLLEFRATTDVMTLSATPIPRTLHMSLLGLRDISSLTTPPLDRRAIVTEVLTYDSQRVKQAIDRELAREGQVFFVHNRVQSIDAMAQQVQQLAPDARVIVGHGQMPMRQLESIMLKFIRGQADILVSTTIIESGIDIPRANTMIINNADMFGLSELHQLRGRVGRYKHRAYCYMMVSPDKVLSEIAMKRLRAIEGFSMLGAGFKIALRDLEIRGAGSLLGAEQSGHIAAVGYEMYCQLLEQEVAQLKNIKRIKPVDTTIDLGITGALPKGYIPSDIRRMDAYRRISMAADFETLEQIEHDLVSAYGELPKAGQRLVQLAELRIAATLLGIASMTRHENDIIIKTRHPEQLEEKMAGAKGTLRMVGSPSSAGLVEVYYRPPRNMLSADTLLPVLRKRLR